VYIICVIKLAFQIESADFTPAEKLKSGVYQGPKSVNLPTNHARTRSLLWQWHTETW